MKKISVFFLQFVVILIGIVVFVLLIRFPLAEGRVTNLDLFHIYTDPFILYGYTASTAFFVALYKAFRLLGYIEQKKVFSSNALRDLRSIKYCAIIISIFIVGAGLFITIFHSMEDDPAGFLALCMITTFVVVVVATTAAVFEKLLQSVVEIKEENEGTV